jgi:hypothetical protein
MPVGVGEPFSQEIVRAMMVLRINSLIKGYSGFASFDIELISKDAKPRYHTLCLFSRLIEVVVI